MTERPIYGPQTAEVEALLARVRTLTDAEARALEVARYAVRGAARDATWYAVRGAARVAARSAAWDAALEAAWGAAWNATWGAVWDAALGAAWGAAWNATWGAVWDAALALVARDLITDAGFTQVHYDLLTGPWRRVVGRVHPEDAPLTGMGSPA